MNPSISEILGDGLFADLANAVNFAERFVEFESPEVVRKIDDALSAHAFGKRLQQFGMVSLNVPVVR